MLTQQTTEGDDEKKEHDDSQIRQFLFTQQIEPKKLDTTNSSKFMKELHTDFMNHDHSAVVKIPSMEGTLPGLGSTKSIIKMLHYQIIHTQSENGSFDSIPKFDAPP